MKTWFSFAGRSSKEFGILVDSASMAWASPEHDYDMISVPGRDGDLYIDNKRDKNVEVTYKCAIGVDFRTNMDAFRTFVAANNGYQILKDSIHPEEFRLAVISAVQPRVVRAGVAGEFDVKFNCKPQRYLDAGDVWMRYIPASQGSQLTFYVDNPTLFSSKPLIRVYGKGILRVDGMESVNIADCTSYVDIDSEAEECYEGAINRNGDVTLLNNTFPVLHPGKNTLSADATISAVEMKTRFFTK